MQKISEWDAIYKSGDYTNYWGLPFPSQELVAFLATKNFPPGSHALDIGCGAGQESVFIAQQGLSVIGVDISKEALKIASERAKKAGVTVDFREGNALQLPLLDQSVDMVNDRGCFHMIPPEDRTQYVSELARVIKPEGTILLRGCRKHNTGTFHPVTKEIMDSFFSANFFIGPVLPIELTTGSLDTTLPANIVILQRK